MFRYDNNSILQQAHVNSFKNWRSGVSESVQSACEMRPGWANMLHRRKDAVHSTPQWGYVAVPHHCGCRIYPRMGPLVSN